MKFPIIVCDIPWSFSDKIDMIATPRGAQANYTTMSLEDIKKMPIKELADPEGTLLALWVPSSLLSSGFEVLSAWGFQHKQTYIWVKTKKNIFSDFKSWVRKSIVKQPQVVYDKFVYMHATKSIMDSLKNFLMKDTLAFGMGRLFRQSHEICLIATNNNKIYKKLENKSQRSVSFGENLKHSAKPDHLQDSLDIMFPHSNKVELFARRIRPGWLCLGNEVCNGEDIFDSIKRVQNML